MIYKELMQLVDYDIPVIEVYNTSGQLEYVIDLDQMYFEDIDIMSTESDTGEHTYYGIIKLYRHEQTKIDGTKL